MLFLAKQNNVIKEHFTAVFYSPLDSGSSGGIEFLKFLEDKIPFLDIIKTCIDNETAVDAVLIKNPDFLFIACSDCLPQYSDLFYKVNDGKTEICFIISKTLLGEFQERYVNGHFILKSFDDKERILVMAAMMNKILTQRNLLSPPNPKHANWMHSKFKIRYIKNKWEEDSIHKAMYFNSTNDGKTLNATLDGGITGHCAYSISKVMDLFGKDFLFQTDQQEIIVLNKIAFVIMSERKIVTIDGKFHIITRERMAEFKKIKNRTWWEMK